MNSNKYNCKNLTEVKGNEFVVKNVVENVGRQTQLQKQVLL
jgi:hypothetical protein